MMRHLAPALVILVTLAATFAIAGPGLGISKDASLAGTGSNGSPLGVSISCGAGSAVRSVSGGTVTCVAASGGGGGISGLTTNTVPKATSSTAIGDSSVTDNGTTWAINTNKVSVTEASGNTSIAGTLGVTGDFAVNTSKLTVNATTGNTLVAGDFAQNGNCTLGDAITDTTTVNGYIGLNMTPDSNVGLKITKPTGATYGLYVSTGQALINETLTENGNLTVAGNTTLGDAASDTILFNNGPTGVNSYDGRHLEWSDEWMNGTLSPTATLNWPAGNWNATATAASLFTVSPGTTTRPGIVELTTGTATTGRASLNMGTASTDFGSGSWTYEAVVGFPTLSTAAQEYYGALGFQDGVAANQVDGCYFAYDRLPVSTAPGTGSITAGADKWQCWCASNSVRTGYTMDGTIVSQESFTTVNAPIAALTLPSTNIYRLKIVMTGTTRAEFYVNGVKSCDINTNIPSGSTRLTGGAINLLKSAGTTSVSMDVDYTKVAVDLNAARSP